ncbi:MAG: hypothetical protein MUP90_17935, partial [Gammaproteobacteria bacterium]|nr:hypothetical protein [Gammaproteobacteria bacterium]
MKTTQTIQWKRLAAEVIAIVASILFAFAIDAWWDDRSDSIRLAGAIQNIAAEVAEARIEIEHATQRNQFRIDGMRRFLSLDPDALTALPQDSLASITKAFATPSPFDTSGFALQGLLTGGNLEIIANEELGSALIVWAQFPNEIEHDYFEAIQLSLTLFGRIAKHGVFLAITNEMTDQVIPGAVPLRDALVSLRRDAESVEAMAQLLAYFEDFNEQLAEGIDYAD